VDLVLPNLDGIELFRMIRLEPKKRNLSVVFLINAIEDKQWIESLGLQPDGFLKKSTACNSLDTSNKLDETGLSQSFSGKNSTLEVLPPFFQIPHVSV
jgi:CheY-like chemotaxis protein